MTLIGAVNNLLKGVDFKIVFDEGALNIQFESTTDIQKILDDLDKGAGPTGPAPISLVTTTSGVGDFNESSHHPAGQKRGDKVQYEYRGNKGIFETEIPRQLKDNEKHKGYGPSGKE